LRQGQARHLLAWLGPKRAILGPPRIVAEVPETLAAACGLFAASGYAQEAILTDYVLERGVDPPQHADKGRLVIPVTVDDLGANGLLEQDAPTGWEHAVETLTARKNEISGLAVATDERIEAYLLYMQRGEGPEPAPEAGPTTSEPTTEIVSLRSLVEDGGARLKQLLTRLGMGTLRFRRVHPAEISKENLETLGFRPVV